MGGKTITTKIYMNSNSRLLPSLAACFAFSLTAWAAPVTTAFNYQGRLDRNGAVANGVFDLKFDLYSDEVGGTPVAPTREYMGRSVSGGLISVDVDFGGPEVFDGRAFWLEISARVQGATPYVLLPGRTSVRPTPYSIYALRAASVKDGGVTNISLAPGAVTAAKLAPGAVGLAQLNLPAPPQNDALLANNGGVLGWQIPQNIGPWGVTSGVGVYHFGKVGIGTTTPSHALTIASTSPSWTSNGWIGAVALPNASAIAWGANAGGQRFGMGHSNGGFSLFRTTSDPATTGSAATTDFMVTDTGNVGIGTITPANKLTVQTSGSGYGLEHTNGVVRMGTYVGGAGWFGTISNHPLYFLVNDGGSPSMSIATNGNVGVGTTSPAQKLDVAGNIKATVMILRADPVAPTNAAVICEDAGVTQFVPYNTATNKPLNIVVTDASVRALTIRGGADLAEPFAMSHQGVEPGTVVVIDAANPGKLKASTRAYDKKVAGIVSGANGIRPGISMIQEDKLEAGENVALSGRVYVKADTSAGSIEPGDLLTSSSTAGHAMKAADHDQAQGAIIGKAMTPLADGDGMVLVLVSLQ